jgi:hypothetical protein
MGTVNPVIARRLPSANDNSQDCRRKGRYQTRLDDLGECAIVDLAAGDGAPFLPREIYDALHFRPPFEDLPAIEDWEQLGLLIEHSDDEPMIG